MSAVRRLWLWLWALGVGACGGAPTPPAGEGASSEVVTGATTEAADTTATPTETATAGDACSPMPPPGVGYDPCPGSCGDGQCLYAEEAYGVCTWGCTVDCDCWPAPEGGTARPRCSTTLLEALPVCVLDCSIGRACPTAMICLPDLGICAHPALDPDGSSGTTDAGSGSTGSESTGGIPPD